MAIASTIIGSYSLREEVKSDTVSAWFHAVDNESSTEHLVRIFHREVSSSHSFAVRWQLIKTAITHITHDNILPIYTIASVDNTFFIAYPLPQLPLTTMADITPHDIDTSPLSRERFFCSLAKALLTIQHTISLHPRYSMVFNTLCFSDIIIDNGSPKITGYFDAFLAFGDTPQAPILNSMAKNKFFLQGNHITPYQMTAKGLNDAHLFTYNFGMIVYAFIAGQRPIRLFPTLTTIDKTLPKEWDTIVEKCLSCNYQSLTDVIDALQAMLTPRISMPTKPDLSHITPPDNMVLVAPLTPITIGANDGPQEEQPEISSTVAPFFIDITPITCQQYKEFLPSYNPSSYSHGKDHPATLVSWYAAHEYCRWRSAQEGLPHNTYRIPTEYEWEAAARGTTGDTFPWGNEYDPAYLLCNKERDHGTLPTNAHPPARFGIYDMLGNVWEWTDTPYAAHNNPKKLSQIAPSDLIVTKGGCWLTPSPLCRNSLRGAFPRYECRGNIGFRCVRSLTGSV